MRELYRVQRVSVLDGGAFGKGTAGFIRLCFTTDERSLREGCARIRQFVSSLRSKTEGA
jgi:aspartate/methionine/tyrosine aminotransferase